MKKFPLLLATIVVIAVGGYALYDYLNPYHGLVTNIEVQSDAQTIATLENQLAQTLASIQAAKDSGERPDLDLYIVAASNAYYLGDLVQAREIYEEYFTENSINPTAWNTYGNILARMEDWDLAEQAYRKALDISQVEEYYRDLINLIDNDESRNTEVRDLLLDYIDELGQTQWVMVSLGEWYANNGECKKSLEHYEIALTIAKNQGMDTSALEYDIAKVEETCIENE